MYFVKFKMFCARLRQDVLWGSIPTFSQEAAALSGAGLLQEAYRSGEPLRERLKVVSDGASESAAMAREIQRWIRIVTGRWILITLAVLVATEAVNPGADSDGLGFGIGIVQAALGLWTLAGMQVALGRIPHLWEGSGPGRGTGHAGFLNWLEHAVKGSRANVPGDVLAGLNAKEHLEEEIRQIRERIDNFVNWLPGLEIMGLGVPMLGVLCAGRLSALL